MHYNTAVDANFVALYSIVEFRVAVISYCFLCSCNEIATHKQKNKTTTTKTSKMG